MKEIGIDPLSCIPLFIDMFKNEQSIAIGTCFVVKKNEEYFIITNWHCVTGRNPDTNEPLSKIIENVDPDTLKIFFHGKSLGHWKVKTIPLLDSDKKPTWIGHGKGSAIDVVAIPFGPIKDDMKIYDLDLKLKDTDLIIRPSETVSIIGFPNGIASAGKFPIWKTGHIASDIDLDWKNLPCFLIDATTKSGMSGSPVMVRRVGSAQTSKGMTLGGTKLRWLGIYSGRIDEKSEIGMVWKPDVIEEIIDKFFTS